jgi:hypothetical protein
MRFLTCEPPIKHEQKLSDYLDEADQFYSNPNEWFKNNYDNLTHNNGFNYIVLFKNLYDELKLLKSDNNDKSIGVYLEKFQILKSFFHSFIIQSNRNHRELLILFKSDKVK